MSEPAAQLYITSRYNFRVPIDAGSLVFNSGTGAMLQFSGLDAAALAIDLTGARAEFKRDSVSTELLDQLCSGGFIVLAATDEVAEIRGRYWRARDDTPMVLTITTTIDCNLGCYYCYEERSDDRLHIKDIEAIVRLAESKLDSSGKRSLHIDWYGGEPLMNLAFMEEASLALQKMCDVRSVRYISSVISNGTCWPEDVGNFVRTHKIRQIQISFDGLRAHHDRRRHYRKEHASIPAKSSFDQAVSLVDRLLDHAHVDLRLNVDRNNREDVVPFVRFARERGWFGKNYQTKVQAARLASYSDHSSFMRNWELSLEEYDAIRELVRVEVGGEAGVEESESPDGYPYPKTSVCAALANHSVVIGADARLYRCGLQVGESHRIVGSLDTKPSALFPILDQQELGNLADDAWWKQFDPTTLPTCSRCSFLPVCWAGCPKKHLECDEHAIAEQGHYWRSNLPRLIATGAGTRPISGFAFSLADQFR